MGPPETTVVANNILAARGVLRYVEAVERLPDGTFTQESCAAPPYVRYTGNTFLGRHIDPPADRGTARLEPSLEAIEQVVLDGQGMTRPGLETLDDFIRLMGWPAYCPTR